MLLSRAHKSLCSVALALGAAVVLHGCARKAAPLRQLPEQGGTLTIRAFVDGRDMLTIDGHVLRWVHLDDHYAAVGRYNGNRPTIVNGIKWYPNWGEASDFRTRLVSVSEQIPYVPTIPRYRDTDVKLESIHGGRKPGAFVKLLPREHSRAPVRLLFDNSGSDPHSKWVEVKLAWATCAPPPQTSYTRLSE